MKFYTGQHVEVTAAYDSSPSAAWRKAKIIAPWYSYANRDKYLVELSDGMRSVFDMDHIRLSRLKN